MNDNNSNDDRDTVKKVKYIRSDGTFSQFLVVKSGYNAESGEILFYEILGQSGIKSPHLVLNGKDIYRRIFIQQVFPVIEVAKLNRNK